MSQENIQLLLQDLCTRQPYGVKVQYDNGIYNIDYISALYEEIKLDIPDNYTIGISEIKPYLRPKPSMTEDELQRYHELCDVDEEVGVGSSIEIIAVHDTPESLDYLNSIHVDYRGLIPKGLALEAPEGMYNI